jgi:hypothetical protein
LRWDGFGLLDIHTNLHDNRLRYLKIIKIINPQTERMQFGYDQGNGFIKYDAEMASVGMIYIPSFMTIGSGVPKMLRGYTNSHQHIRLLLFFQNNENKLKTIMGQLK